MALTKPTIDQMRNNLRLDIVDPIIEEQLESVRNAAFDMIIAYAPEAPQPLVNEAIYRLAAVLFGAWSNPDRTEPQNILQTTGVKAMLSPFVTRNALVGRAGD